MSQPDSRPTKRTSTSPLHVLLALCLVASTLVLAVRPATADAAAADVNSMNFYGSELIWQPGDPQPVHDTNTNTVSSFGPIKDVVCGTVVTFFQRIEMSGGTDNVLELNYRFGYDSSADQPLGLRDVVGLTIHPDSTDLDGDAGVSLLSEAIIPSEDDSVPAVREYTPVIEVTGLDAGDIIWVQIDVEVGCDPGTGSSGTAQAIYDGAVETTSGEPLGGGSQTIPGLSPSAPPSWGFSKQAFDADGNPITIADPYQEVTFVFTVENTGLVGLNAPTLSDSVCAPVTFIGGDLNTNTIIDASSPEWPGGTFDVEPAEPAEVWTWECTMTIGEGDHTNVGTLSGMPARGVGPTESTVSFPVNPATPGVTVTKSVDPAFIETGDTVTWTIDADNTGNVPLTGVTLTDPNCASPTFVAASDINADGWLDTNEIWSWTCTSPALTATTPNTATVTAQDPGATVVMDSGSATATLIAMTLDKVPPAGPISATGDVTYSFIVTNTGDATLDPISVDDPKTGAVSCPVTSLAPGANTTCTSTYTVTQDDLDAGQVVNSATATGTAPDGVTTTGAADSETTPLQQLPAMTVAKSTTSTPTAAGDTLEYSFLVTNTGNVSITGVTVTDTKCATTPALQSGDTDLDSALDVDEAWTFTCTSIEVTQDEVDAGQVDNDVTVTGTPAGGTLDPATGSDSTTITPTPSWTVAKSTISAPTEAGDTLVYSFEIVNTGNVSIADVTVTDAKCATVPALASGDTDLDTELDPDEIWTLTCTSVGVTQDEVDAGETVNSVSVTGTPPGGTLDPADDTETTPIVRSAGMEVVKSTASTPTAAGDTLEYSFLVTNTGNVSIADVTVTDAKCATTPVLVSGDTDLDENLDVDEAWTFTCTSVGVTQDEVDAGQTENNVQVDGVGTDGSTPFGTDSVTTSITPDPSWTVAKSTTSAPTEAGDTLEYSFLVDNTGNVSITGVTVADAKCAAAPTLASGDTDLDGALDPDETWTFTCTSIGVTQDEVDAGETVNSVSVTGTPPGGTLTPAVDTETTPITPDPSWTVAKSTASAPTAAGDTLEYSFLVDNTGNVSITGVTVADAKCAAAPTLASGDTDLDGALDPDETWTFTCTSIGVTQDEVDAGETVNSVSVTGTPPGGTLTPAVDTETTPITPDPSWTVAKSTASTPTAAGDTLEYSFLVDNTGNVSITGVTVADAKCATTPVLDGGDTDLDGELDVDETWTFTCTSIGVTQDEVDAGQVDNNVSVTGTPPGGTLTPATDTDSTTITAAASWTVAKSTASTPTAVGDTLEYSFLVDNTGNVSIADVTVTDAKCATTPALDSGDTDLDGELDVDETWTFTCTSIGVTQDEIDAGETVNSVSVTGTPPGGTLDPATDTEVTDIDQLPSWIVAKSTDSTPTEAGDTLEYSFAITNTGNVSIVGVAVADAKCATAPALASGDTDLDNEIDIDETWTFTCTSIVVTQEEVDAGQVDNDVTVSGTAGGVPIFAADTETTPITPVPAWTLVKSTASAPTAAGEFLTYTFIVDNTGNVSVNSVVVADAKCLTAPAYSSGDADSDTALDPTETWTFTCTSIAVTQDEVDAGEVLNSASVTGTPVDGVLDPAESSIVTGVTQTPSLSVIKSTASTPTAAGDTLEYSFLVDNTGNVSIADVTVVDAKCATTPALDSGDTDLDGELDVDETWTFTCTSIAVTQDEVDAGQTDNSVVVTGTPAGGTLAPGDDSLVTPIEADPKWEVVKAATTVPAKAGDTIDYTFAVVSTGNVTITDVTVADDKCATAPVLDSESITTDGELEPGETQVWTCTSIPVTQAEIDAGEVRNDVLVTGTPSAGTLAPIVDDHLVGVTGDPSWTIFKSTTSTPAAAGDTLDYSFTVINTGNVSISSIAVDDPKCATTPVLSTESVANDGIAEPGESQIWTCTSIPVTQSEVDAGTVDNVALITGSPAAGTLDPTPASAETPIAASPAWTLTKSSSSVPTAAGDTLDYSFVLTNTGNVSVDAITVADDKCTSAPTVASGDDGADLVLSPGEIWTLTCTSIPVTQDEVDAGQVDNTATATGTPAAGTLVDATGSSSITIDAAPEWSLVKATASAPTAAGDTLDYTFTVVNTGNVTISDVAIDDAKCAAAPTLVSESSIEDGILGVAETQIWSCTSIAVTQAEIDAGFVDNAATVSGTPAGGLLDDAADTHTAPIAQAPQMEVAKTSGSTPNTAGETLTYSFSVVNTGNISISDVLISDDKCAATPVLDLESIAADTVLAPGETQVWSCTSVPVTQEEIDAGEIVNDVTVTGTPAGGTLLPVTDTHVIDVVPAPAWNVVKTTASVPVEAGDTLLYTFTVSNDGNVSISGITVTDIKCAADPTLNGGDLNGDSKLDTDETWVYSCASIAVTQAEVDAGQVDNTVTVSGTPALGSLDDAVDSYSTPIEPAAAWSVFKATASTVSAAGETVDYTFTVVNGGNVTIRSINVADAKCATTPVLDSESMTADGELEPGETQIWSCTSVPVTQDEIDAGLILNDVTLTGTPAGGTLDPAFDDHTLPVAAGPSWTLVKGSDSVPNAAGDTLEYSFSVVNTGNVTISDVVITDGKCATVPVLVNETIDADTVLRVGETQTWTCTSIPVTQAEVDAGQIDNTASATGTPAGGVLADADDSLTRTVTPAPSWSLAKTIDGLPQEAGDTIDYEFAVINTGNVTIENVVVTDAKCGTVPAYESGDTNTDSRLDVDEIWNFTCTSIPVTQAEVDAGRVDNSASVAGDPVGGTLDPATDDITAPIEPAPAWSVVKSTVDNPTAADETLEYTFSVVNTGNVTITVVSVDDAKCATIPALLSESIAADTILQVGETQVWSCTSVPVIQAEIDAGEILNDVNVIGVPAGGVLDDAADDLVTFAAQSPSWAMVKAASTQPFAAGDVIDYTFAVINDGNVSISGVSIADPKCAVAPVLDSESMTADGVLEVGETQIWSCTSIEVTQTEADAGQVDNTATATGVPAGGTLDPAVDDATTPLPALPAWSLVKSTDSVANAAGDSLDYTFELTNTGNVTIDSPAVTDPKCDSAPTLDTESMTADAVLEVGETQVWSCTSIAVTQAEVDAGQVDNTATATGVPANGTLEDADASLTTPVSVDPSFELVKSTASDVGIAGDTIEYQFTVVNTGNVTITGAAIADAKCATTPVLATESIAADAILAAGEVQTWTCTSVAVTQAEVDAGEVDNTATLSGTPAGGTLDPVDDSHTLDVLAQPSLAVAKATSSNPAQAGDTLSYTFTVVNTGNVTIASPLVSDPKCASAVIIDSESIDTDGVLQVGETQVWSCTSVGATQTEVDAGQVDNEVGVTGTPAGGELPPGIDTVSTPVVAAPSWSLVKTTSSNPAQAGDTLDYTFTVENTGNVTISDVAVADSKCASAPTISSESIAVDGVLEVGETQVWTCTSIAVTQDEVDAGQVINTATATGTPARGTLDSLEDTHTQPILPNPSFAAVKSTSSIPAGAGDTLDYTFTLVNTGNVSIAAPSISDAKCATTPALDLESMNADGVLEVGETQVWSCTSVPVSQDDVDAGFVINVATISGTPSGGVLDPSTIDHTAPISAQPGLEVVKAGGEQPTAAGDTIDYAFTIVNTGNVTIADVALSDAKCATAPALNSESITLDGLLQVGETQVWSCTSVPVTQAEIDAGQVDNTVTVEGSPAGGELDPATDTDVVGVDAEPAWTLAKSTDSTVAAAGDVLEYQFVLVNTGNVTVNDAVVIDLKCASTPSLDSESDIDDGILQVGEVWELSCTSIAVTQAEVDATEVNNTASASGTPVRGSLADVFASVSTDITAAPAFEVAKSSSSTPGGAGETLNYSFTVVNTGNVTLSSIDIDDPKCATAPTLDTESIADDGIAQVGEVQTWSCVSIPVTQAEADAGQVDNTATISAIPTAGTVDPVTAVHTVPLDAAPSAEVVKATADMPLNAGDVLTYSFSVVNTGNVTVADIAVTDDKCATTPVLDSESMTADGLLEVGEVQIWSCVSIGATQTEIDAGQVDNVVAISGTPSGGSLGETTDDESTPVLAAPAWTMTKSTDSEPARAGDTLDYTFAIESTGNVTISDIAINDAKCATVPALVAESVADDALLSPGEIQTWSCTSVGVTQDEVDAGQVDNLATVEGVPTRGTLPPTSATSATPIIADGSIELVKSVGEIIDTNATGEVDAGDFVTYSFSVTNTGNVVLSNVAIDDSSATVSGGPLAMLAPGETDATTFTAERFLSQADIDAGFVDNTAAATGRMPNGAVTSDISDSENPADTGSVDEFGNPAVDEFGNPIDDADATNDPTRLVLPADPSISLLKTSTYIDSNSNNVVDPGDEIRYVFTVTNTGNVTLTDIAIDDPSVTVDGGPLASLAPGASDSTTFSAVRVIDTADIDAGGVTNTAMAQGTAPDGVIVEDVSDDPVNDTNVDPDGDGNPDDPTFTSLTPNPSLDLVKTAVSFPVSDAGNAIMFDLVVTNNGTVTVTDVAVHDELLNPDAPICDPSTDAALASLAPGDSVTCRVAYNLTQADVDAGGVTNTATVEGSDPSGDPVTDVSDSGSRTPPGNDGSGSDDPTFVQIPSRPELELIKTAVGSDPDPITGPGAEISYTFTVTNTGNVTVTDVVVSDDRADVECPAGSLEALAPFDSVTCKGRAVVTQDDVDLGGFVNTATATGVDPTGNSVRDVSDSGGDTPPGNDGSGTDDPTWSTIVTDPSLNLVKTVASTVGNGDGSWNISWLFTVTNDGNVTIDGVSIVDELVSSLPAGALDSVTDVAVSTGPCSPNAAFDGLADPVVATAASLAPAEGCVVQLDTIVIPGDGVSVIANTATAQGTAPDGDPVDDVSDSGDETVDAPGPDGVTDGDPTNDVTVIDLSESPLIGIAKALTVGPELLDDGGWSMTFALTVENLGDVPLAGLQIQEDLVAAFQGAPYTIDAIEVDGPCTIADDFDGDAVTGLLSGDDVFALDGVCVIDLVLTVRPAGRMIGENQVVASGTSPGGTTVTDLSTIGSTADPDSDGSPDEEEPNPFVLAPPAAPDQKLDNPLGAAVTIDPLVNDGSGVPLDPTSVVLLDPATDERVTTLVVAGEGAWAVDPETGLVTFTPAAGFQGDPTPVDYEVTVAGTEVVLGSTVEITYVDPAPTRPTVVIPPSPAPSFVPPPALQADTPEPPEGPLAFTGSSAGLLASIGLLLVLIGAAFVFASRRPRDENAPRS